MDRNKKEMPKWLQDKERDEGTLVETLRGRGRFQGEGVRAGREEGGEELGRVLFPVLHE